MKTIEDVEMDLLLKEARVAHWEKYHHVHPYKDIELLDKEVVEALV